MTQRLLTAAFAASVALLAGRASATDLEVTHWWTSGGEAAAVAELAKAFDATGNHWVDGAIAGSGGTARPIMISRITGGDPMGATQFNHGRQAEELVQAGLMRDLTDVATKEKWKDIVKPASLLDSCTIDGKIYCAPVNIHSWQWLWLSNDAFKKAGVDVPKNWDEFVAAAPALEKAGIVPLAIGGQPWGAFDVLMLAIGGKDTFLKVFGEKNAEAAAGPEIAKVFKAAEDARRMSKGTNVQDWNQATNMVITGKAGMQFMGDWARGEFLSAGQTAGKEFGCFLTPSDKPAYAVIVDIFAFPVNTDEDRIKGQTLLAETVMDPAVESKIAAVKGSVPSRLDVDTSTLDACAAKGVSMLAKPGEAVNAAYDALPGDMNGQVTDLATQFWTDPSMTAEAAIATLGGILQSQ